MAARTQTVLGAASVTGERRQFIPSSPSAVNNNLRKGWGLITQSLPGWGRETAVSMYADGRPSLVLVARSWTGAPRALEGSLVANGWRPRRVRHRGPSKYSCTKTQTMMSVFIFFYFFFFPWLSGAKNVSGTNCTCVVASCDNRRGRARAQRGPSLLKRLIRNFWCSHLSWLHKIMAKPVSKHFAPLSVVLIITHNSIQHQYGL